MSKSVTKGGVTSTNGRCVAQLRSLQNVGDGLPLENAQYVAKKARGYAHVITGQMRDHTVAKKVNDKKAEVVSTMPYAGFEEFGTKFRPAHPFIRPAVIDGQNELPNMNRKEVNREIRRRVNAA
jgi:HK97 gp10 family phage protein